MRGQTVGGRAPHVTILFPFVPAAELDEETIDRVRSLFVRFPAFDVVLRDLRRFPGVLYLAPEPGEPFRRMIEAAAAAYPERPPYGGRDPARRGRPARDRRAGGPRAARRGT